MCACNCNNKLNEEDWRGLRGRDGVMQDIKNMSVRQYLDHTVVPMILQAMTELAKER